MGQKVPATALRIGINKYWRSRWFFSKKSVVFLEADYWIREIIKKNFPRAGVIEVIIERKSHDHAKVIIETSKPGLLIGKEGQALKELIRKIEKKVNHIFISKGMTPPSLDVDIVEVKKPLLSAMYLAEMVAQDLERGFNTRKILKRVIERARQQKEILGIKIKAKGRLDGSTIKRSETVSWGRIPLSKLVADIDYAQLPVLTKYGILGVKVWVYRGDKDSYENDAST
ncbi:MAG: 30S ribosomal protein S3 [Patescibacteria group bacterium]|nr:30S ribosomal protein S3 [Patescibacteria group bacterium]